MSGTVLYPNNNLPLSNQWFDYTLEMNVILNTLHQRILNLEIALQASNQISNRSHSMIEQNLSSLKSTVSIRRNQLPDLNLIDTPSERSRRNSLTTDQHFTLEKQLEKLNFSSQMSFEQIKESSIGPNEGQDASPSGNLPPNQMKTRADEFAAIFEDTFDQLNILHISLSTTNHHEFSSEDTDPNHINSNCTLTGISIMNESEKIRYEIEYFVRLLLLFFRALILDSPTSLNQTYNQKELMHLHNRLKTSQEQISKFSLIKKHFYNDKSKQLTILHSTNAQLTDRFMEEQHRSKVALRYSHDWKTNHLYQWIQMLLQIERDSIQTIHQYESHLKETEIVHEETIRVLIEQRDEMKLKANRSYEYYQNETSRFERELTDIRFEFNQMKRQREEMFEEYHRMHVVVDEDNQRKMKERLLVEKQKEEEEAMKRIEAWWRGTMIRQLKQTKRKKKKKKL